MDRLPGLPQLTPDDRYWRIDWFGECAYPGGVQRFAQPSIQVSISPLRVAPDDNDALLGPGATDVHLQREVWPPVAVLPLLSIGDIWHAGQHFVSPDYQVERFRKLRVAPETTTFVKSGLAIDERFLLPLSQHPWHRSHTQSYCVTVSLDDQRRVLIPCMELIRFYFGSSSNFLQRLFTAPLSAEHFYSAKRFNPENRHLHLVLASRLSGASAADIGRIAESSLAWRSAAGIFSSCQKASAQRHPAYPYTGFPFEGTTDLVASGVWLPFGEIEDATFLVYRLRSCSHPFPFASLSYEAADRKKGSEKGSGAGNSGSHVVRERSPANPNAAEGDAGTSKSQRRGGFRSKRQFPDLFRKQIWREKIEAMPKADVFLRKSNGELIQVAYGESDTSEGPGGFDAQEIDHTPITDDIKEVLPHFVRTALAMIRTDLANGPDTQVLLISPSSKGDYVFSLPFVVDEEGEIDERLIYRRPDGSTRQRRACFLKVYLAASINDKYLIIVEGTGVFEKPAFVPGIPGPIAEVVTLLLRNE